MASAATKVVSDKKLQQQLAKNGKEFVSENYDWMKISKRLDHIYQQVGNRHAN